MKRTPVIFAGLFLLPACAAIIGLGDQPEARPDDAGTINESGTTTDASDAAADSPVIPVDAALPPQLDPTFNETGILPVDGDAVAMAVAGLDIFWFRNDGTQAVLGRVPNDGKGGAPTPVPLNGSTSEIGSVLVATQDSSGATFFTIGGTGLSASGRTYWARTYRGSTLEAMAFVQGNNFGTATTVAVSGVGYQPSKDQTTMTYELMTGSMNAVRFIRSPTSPYFELSPDAWGGPVAVVEPGLGYFVSSLSKNGNLVSISQVPFGDETPVAGATYTLVAQPANRGKFFGTAATSSSLIFGALTTDSNAVIKSVKPGSAQSSFVVPVMPDVTLHAMTLQGDKILMAGCVGNPSRAWIARFAGPANNAALDTTFGKGGQFVIDGTNGECAASVGVDRTGRILVLVTGGLPVEGGASSSRIIRYMPN